MTKTCVQCGKTFELTESEIKFYKSKNLDIPKRCAQCRSENKAAKRGKNGDPTVKKQSKGNNFPIGGTSRKNPKNSKLRNIIIAVVILILIATGGISKFGGQSSDSPKPTETQASAVYKFRNDELLSSHYKKHGIDMGFASPAEYEAAASAVITNPSAEHKTEKEDGDGVYYIASTREFVVLSTDGYIRTYYYADADYFARQ